MQFTSHRPRFLYALALLPVLLGAKEGKRGCCQTEPPEDTQVHDTSPPPVEGHKVTSIDPSTAKPDESFSAKIYGSKFKDGATVSFNDVASHKVMVLDANTIQAVVPALAAGVYDVKVDIDGVTATLRRGLTVRASTGECSHVTVNFDFDQSGLTDSGRSTLDSNMPCFQAASGAVRIEGHADERGTTEYNLALGERRADAVKRYLANGGVGGSRLSTVSYGEEKPAATGSDESAWAQNRRAEIYVSE